MRHWATGISVVGSSGPNRQVHGMTVNSFISIALEPPLVLVSLERITRTHEFVDHSGAFSVSILHEGQQAISDRFAGRESEHTDRFDGVPYHTEVTGAPVLDDCLAALDCRVVSSADYGTHTVYIGEAVAAKVSDGRQPLLYFHRAYRRLIDP